MYYCLENCWANPHLCLANHGFCSERSRTMMTLVWKVISFCDKGICRPATSELINIFGQSVFSWIPSFLDFSSPWENTMSWNYFLLIHHFWKRNVFMYFREISMKYSYHVGLKVNDISYENVGVLKLSWFENRWKFTNHFILKPNLFN